MDRPELKKALKNLVYFKTVKLHPTGTNTTSHVLDDEAIAQILALFNEEEIRKQERERIIEWLEYNAPEYVWQRFKDGKDVRQALKGGNKCQK